MLPENRWKLTNNSDVGTWELIIRKCLSIIRFVTVIGNDGTILIKLDKPDFNLLESSKI